MIGGFFIICAKFGIKILSYEQNYLIFLFYYVNIYINTNNLVEYNMNTQVNKTDFFPKFLIIVMLASLPFACSKAIDYAFDRQAETDYQEYLSWQADGYAVRCIKG